MSKTENTAKEKEEKDLGERIYQFVIRIVNLVKEMPNTIAGNRIGGQLLDAGTSIGANYEESRAAFSKADFTYKMSTARREVRYRYTGRKESYETHYWLRVIRDTVSRRRRLLFAELLPRKRMFSIIKEGGELKKILTSAVKTAQENPD